MLPLALFRNLQFSAGGATIFFLWGSALGSVYFMAQYFQTGQGLDALAAGVRMIAWGSTTTFIPRLVGKRIPARGAPIFIAIGMTLHALSLLWFATAADPDRGYVWLVVPLVLSGAGCAMASPAAQALTLTSLHGPQIGTAAGAFSMFRQLGGAAGVAAMIAGFGNFGTYGNSQSFTHGFAAALVVGAGLAAIAGVAGGGPFVRLLNRVPQHPPVPTTF
jgi:MFS family permease